jgi:hypothetical protein
MKHCRKAMFLILQSISQQKKKKKKARLADNQTKLTPESNAPLCEELV